MKGKKEKSDERKNAEKVSTPCQRHEKGETQEFSSRQNNPTKIPGIPAKEKKRAFIPFNAWSKRKIAEGKKFCTSRSMIYNDERVIGVVNLPWGIIKKYLYEAEGADSPEELQKVINNIHRRVVPDDKLFWVHFGNFKKTVIDYLEEK